jgi:hypothetical protein
MFGNNNQNSDPWKPQTLGNQNSFSVTLNGETKTVSGANDSLSAARQAFGPEGDKARVVQTDAKKW